MNNIQVNFSRIRAKNTTRYLVFLNIMILFVGAYCLYSYLHYAHQLDNLQAKYHGQNQKSTVIQKPSEHTLEQVKAVDRLLMQLNIQWNPMLTQLETAKAGNQDVFLNLIQPDPLRKEIYLAGQAGSVDQLLTFMADLAAESAFSDVVLLNQRMEPLTQGPQQFSLKLRWHNVQ